MTGVQTCALPICFPVTIIGVIKVYDRRTLELKLSLNLGVIEKPSQLEKIRSLLAENNAGLLFASLFCECIDETLMFKNDGQKETE